MFLGCPDQGFDIFRETGTAISASRIKELTSDTRIGSDSATHHIYVSSNQFTQIGNVIHKADSGRQHGIGSIFCHLGRRDIHKNHPEVIQQERTIQLTHQFPGFIRFHSHDNPVRSHKVIDGITFLQEFRVRSNIKRNLHSPGGLFSPDHFLYLAGCSYRHRTFSYNKYITLHAGSNGSCYFQYVFQICTSVFIRRSSDCSKYNRHLVQTILQRGSECQAPGLYITLYHFLQSRFINRNNPFLQGFDLGSIGINTNNVCSCFSKTCTCHQPYISGSHDSYIHNFAFLFFF